MIKGKKVVIRPLKEQDLSKYFLLKETLKHLPFEPFTKDYGSEYIFRKKFQRQDKDG